MQERRTITRGHRSCPPIQRWNRTFRPREAPVNLQHLPTLQHRVQAQWSVIQVTRAFQKRVKRLLMPSHQFAEKFSSSRERFVTWLFPLKYNLFNLLTIFSLYFFISEQLLHALYLSSSLSCNVNAAPVDGLTCMNIGMRPLLPLCLIDLHLNYQCTSDILLELCFDDFLFRFNLFLHFLLSLSLSPPSCASPSPSHSQCSISGVWMTAGDSSRPLPFRFIGSGWIYPRTLVESMLSTKDPKTRKLSFSSVRANVSSTLSFGTFLLHIFLLSATHYMEKVHLQTAFLSLPVSLAMSTSPLTIHL